LVREVNVPRIWGRRSKVVEVTFVDDSRAAEEDTHHWVLRMRNFLHWGQPAAAFTVSQVPDLESELAAEWREEDHAD
jgi:hypothetical protein